MMRGSLETYRTLFMKMTISFKRSGFGLSITGSFSVLMLQKFDLFHIFLRSMPSFKNALNVLAYSH